MGFIHVEFKSDPTTALPFFEKAAIVNGNYPAAVYMQGVCKEKKGDKAGAISAYRKTLSINARFEDAQTGLIRLDAKP